MTPQEKINLLDVLLRADGYYQDKHAESAVKARDAFFEVLLDLLYKDNRKSYQDIDVGVDPYQFKKGCL